MGWGLRGRGLHGRRVASRGGGRDSWLVGFQVVDEGDDGWGRPVGGGGVFGYHAAFAVVEEGGGELVELHAGWNVVVVGEVEGKVEMVAAGVGADGGG